MVSAPKAFSLHKCFNIFCLDSELEISGSKIWFCFSVLSSELFLDSPIPVRDHPGQELRATSLLKVPGDTSFWPIRRPPILILTSLPEFPETEEPSTGSPLQSTEPSPPKQICSWLTPLLWFGTGRVPLSAITLEGCLPIA